MDIRTHEQGTSEIQLTQHNGTVMQGQNKVTGAGGVGTSVKKNVDGRVFSTSKPCNCNDDQADTQVCYSDATGSDYTEFIYVIVNQRRRVGIFGLAFAE